MLTGLPKHSTLACNTEMNGFFKEENQKFHGFFGIAVSQLPQVVGLSKKD